MRVSPVYLVTGGCGFIGLHLVHALVRQDRRVRVLDDLSSGRASALPAAAELVVADVRDRPAVRQAMRGVAGCFHLAAVASVERTRLDWLDGHRTNAGGTVVVLEAARDAARDARRAPVPVVYASSAAVYGDAGEPPLREEHRPAPTSPYGADKLGGELHAALARRLFGVPTLGLRFFNVYGPGQPAASPYSGVITLFADRLARGEALTVFGTGRQTRDFVHVDDVVRALLAGMERMLHDGGRGDDGVVNVCTGRETSILEVARILGELAGTPPRVVHEPARPGDILRSVGCPRLLASALGVVARTPVREGLERTILRHGGPPGAAPTQSKVDPRPREILPVAGNQQQLGA
jgi:UDP-glucose 4-epimerase